MKQAKKRPLPTLAKLVSSTTQASHSVTRALAFVSTSNRRIARTGRKASQPMTVPKGLARRPATPVSINMMNTAITAGGAKAAGGVGTRKDDDAVAAVDDTHQFVRDALPVGAVDVKTLINDGREDERVAGPVVENSAARRRTKYALKDLMAQCDPNAPVPVDMQEWEGMVPVGLECDIEITKDDGVFIARCPNPEVASEGATKEEALANLREALDLYFDRGVSKKT